jgi:protein-S-isoprenylcysteine O-methyltransferase Ste14
MTETQPPPHAGVNFPPPFVYVAAFVAGLLLQRGWPLPITGLDQGTARGAVLISGLVLFLMFLGLVASAFFTFGRARTTVIPNRPASALVASGPYRISRNPMYLGLAFGYTGLALLLNTWWPLFFLPLAVIAIDRLVIVREERYLASAFPQEYGAYRSRVRRWL